MFDPIFDYEKSDIFKSIRTKYLTKANTPNPFTIKRFSSHPVLYASKDEIIWDAGLCKTSINDELYEEMYTHKYEVINDDLNEKEFCWVLTDKNLYIVSEKWNFGFGIDLFSAKINPSKGLGIISSKINIQGEISHTPEGMENKSLLNGTLDITISGEKKGMANIVHTSRFFQSMERELRDNNVHKYIFIPILQDDEFHRDLGLIFWFIPSTREILHLGTSPAVMVDFDNQLETTFGLIDIIYGHLEGFDSWPDRESVKTGRKFSTEEVKNYPFLKEIQMEIYQIKYDSNQNKYMDIKI